LVNKRADNRDVNAEISELLQTHVVLDDRYHISADAVDVGIDREMRVSVDGARENWLLIVLVLDTFLQQRRPLGFPKVKASTGKGALALILPVSCVSIVMGHPDGERVGVLEGTDR